MESEKQKKINTFIFLHLNNPMVRRALVLLVIHYPIPLLIQSLVGFPVHLPAGSLENPLVGCRNGLLLDKLKELGYEAKGIELTDIADYAVSRGRDVFKGDIQDRTPYSDKEFRSVIMSHVLEHLHRPDDALLEVHRILDGYLLIHLPLTAPNKEALKKYGEYISFDDINDVKALLERNGFVVEQVGASSPLNQFFLAKTL